MKKTFAGETREQLLAQREELRERLQAIRRDYASGLDRNMEEQSIQLENAEVLAELSREAVEQLGIIESKLRRLEQLERGGSAQCGAAEPEKSERQRQEDRLDESGRESFPASDPPAASAIIRQGPPLRSKGSGH